MTQASAKAGGLCTRPGARRPPRPPVSLSLCLFPLRLLHGDVRAEVLRLEAAVSLSIATGTALLPQPRRRPALGSAVGGRRCHSGRTAQCRLNKGPGGAICGLPLPTCDGAVE